MKRNRSAKKVSCLGELTTRVNLSWLFIYSLHSIGLFLNGLLDCLFLYPKGQNGLIALVLFVDLPLTQVIVIFLNKQINC